MLIGLTGAYCAGKNHVGRLLEARGLQVLDVDKLGHRATEDEKAAIVSRFGPGVLSSDGKVDRSALGKLVFGKPDELAALEAIIHPAANRLAEKWIAERPGGDLVINAALLHRATVFDRLDFIIMVCAPYWERLLRARRRDGLPFHLLMKRFASQKNFAAQYFGKKADIYTVDNRGVFGPCARHREAALERELDTIFAREGMVR
jgi:dephospho-CoA kinase